MSFHPRPHLSAALQHLRVSVTACAIALGVALMAQVGVWATVHYTDARTKQVNAEQAPELRVVRAKPVVKDPSKLAPPAEQAPAEQPAEVNVVPSAGDIVLRGVGWLARTVGVLSALLLSVLMFQAVAVAGGGNVPGVERAITAATLTHLIVLVCLPLNVALGETVHGGVFQPYATLVATSEALRAGGPGAPSAAAYYLSSVLLPLALVAGLVVVILRFRAGIESGVIVTAVSQIDERIEREIRAAKLGQLASPRAMGALNAAMGEEPLQYAPPAPVAAPAPVRPRIEPVPVAPPAFQSAQAPARETYHPGDSTRRPI